MREEKRERGAQASAHFLQNHPRPPALISLSLSPLSFQRPPSPADITAFRIPPGLFIKLHPATWHAGPLFEAGAVGPQKQGAAGTTCQTVMNFANLEMADTNVTDHNTHVYKEGEGFLVVPPPVVGG